MNTTISNFYLIVLKKKFAIMPISEIDRDKLDAFKNLLENNNNKIKHKKDKNIQVRMELGPSFGQIIMRFWFLLARPNGSRPSSEPAFKSKN
ncbi:hypothetical protein BpHYR1_014099 [Brachionus plicatilis]|uniref:Uncharacterized protein n=1 Tax=Brachionus plicatilis TaxID=10195 RepID=A0A3M7PIL0_BRAPC|nr:hypothetical protein BpHYR1_014099 [Brachionus plicatilis]